MFHALIASCAESGDLLDGTLRPGAVGSADGALEFIQRVVERVRPRVCESVLVRMDAGFPDGQTLKGLESAGIDYVARIRNNAVLDRMAQPYLRRAPGRPPREGRVWCHELRYQADSWEHPRRMVLVVLERPGELFLDYFWLITNLKRNRYCGARLLGLYRMRGKAKGTWESSWTCWRRRCRRRRVRRATTEAAAWRPPPSRKKQECGRRTRRCCC